MFPRAEPLETAPRPAQMAALKSFSRKLSGRCCCLGGGRWNEAARAQIARFAERFALPVATSYRRGHLFDQTHPNYAGDLGLLANSKLVARIKDSDLVMVVGARLNQTMTQDYTLFSAGAMKLVHVYPEAEEIGRIANPHLAIQASPQGFAAALETLAPRRVPVWAARNRKPQIPTIALFRTPRCRSRGR